MKRQDRDLPRIRAITAAVVAAAGIALAGTAPPAGATVIYNTWSSNENPNGNYILTIADTGLTNLFNWTLTVSPWNAEALGLFVDLGAVAIPAPVILTNVSPTGQVQVYATDTTSNLCGTGCNLNGGLNLSSLGGGDWELVFRLGDVGFDSIQTFSWTTPDFGLAESNFGVVGIRAQQLCGGNQTLSPNTDTGCGGSDKAYGSPVGGPPVPPLEVPEPASLGLLGLGLLAISAIRRRKIV